jgi:hypothetical protein
MSQPGSSSSLSSPPVSNKDGGGSVSSSQDASITGSGADTERPLPAPRLKGGRKAKAGARGKAKPEVKPTAEQSDEDVEHALASAKSTRATRAAKARKEKDDDAVQDIITADGPAESSDDNPDKPSSHKRKASNQGKGSSPKAARTSLARKAKSKKWNLPFVLTDTNSPLTKTRVRNDLLVSMPLIL